MALSATAWLVIMVVVILSLTFAPNWSLVILIVIGNIAQEINKKRKKKGEHRGDHPDSPRPPGSDQGHNSDRPTLQVDVTPLDVEKQDPCNGSAPAVARPTARQGVAAGKTRRKPELSSTSSSSFGIAYEVFLNFRGPDTRKTITDHLFSRLVSVGISVFKDEEELRAGEEISQEITEAIKQSKISIPIFSKDYAFSKSCLSELEQMWMYNETKGQTIIPIFYDVSPSDVEHQTGDFGRAFDLHKTAGVNSNTITKWREVLQKVGKLREYSGKLYEGYEGQLVEEVVLRVARILRDDGLVVTDKLVGIDPHVEEMMRKLGVAHSEGRAIKVHGEDVRVVGIYGVPGVGKTTLAKVVFNKMHDLFDACSFLPSISSKGVQFSRRMLIADLQIEKPAPLESSGDRIEEIASLCRNAKVLIVLDNVDEDEQIKALVGKLTWFGPESRIIVTTNNKEVLSAFDVRPVEHEFKPLGRDHALQLFCEHAFQGAAVQDVSEYFGLSMDIVKAIGGLPSDIVRHATSLRDNMNIDVWKSTQELLQKHPEDRPPPGGASPLAGDASACAVDAPAPAGEKRTKPELSSPSSSSFGVANEVLLNFRGPDTRKTITDHLFSRLVSVGISVFKDEEELRAGEEISQEITEAIKQSKISIPIFSKDYAFSKSCLSELEQMWMYNETKGQTIIPIFYDVSPSDVEHQTGDFGRAFDLHKTAGVNSNTITKWREVLQKVGKLGGYGGKLYEGYEGQLVEEVVLRVARFLRDDGLIVTDKLVGIDPHVGYNLVGIDPHVEEMMRKLGVAHSEGRATKVHGEDVRVVGIYGVPGVGKTTLAKVVFNKMHDLFDACSFLPGISLKGVKFSRRMLIADLQIEKPAPFESSDEGIKILASQFTTKRVLIVLDDVDDCQQFEALAGKGDWFGSGSRVIVTTKERHVLKACRIVEEHEVEPMSDDHALQLFRHHAFQGDSPEEVSDPEYDSLSKDIVKAVGRVPGDIVHHASYLRRNMGVDNWRSTLELLQKHGKERQAAL